MKKLLIIASLLSITSLYSAKQNSSASESDNPHVRRTRPTTTESDDELLRRLDQRDDIIRRNLKRDRALKRHMQIVYKKPTCCRRLFGSNNDKRHYGSGFGDGSGNNGTVV